MSGMVETQKGKIAMAVSVESRLKELVKLENSHAENVNKLKERISKLEQLVDSLKKGQSTCSPQIDFDLVAYLKSIDESLKCIRSYMSIELYSPYNCYRPKERLHINPYFNG